VQALFSPLALLTAGIEQIENTVLGQHTAIVKKKRRAAVMKLRNKGMLSFNFAKIKIYSVFFVARNGHL